MVTDGGRDGFSYRETEKLVRMLSFNRNQSEYEDGFGDLNEDFWAGLKMMNTLRQKGQWEMRVGLQSNNMSWSYLHEPVQCRKSQ